MCCACGNLLYNTLGHTQQWCGRWRVALQHSSTLSHTQPEHSQYTASAAAHAIQPTLLNQACTLSGRISTPGVSASAAPAVQSNDLRATSTRNCRSALLLLLLPLPGASMTAAAAATPAGRLDCAFEAPGPLLCACAVCCARAAAAAGLSSTAGVSNPLAWMILQEHARQGRLLEQRMCVCVTSHVSHVTSHMPAAPQHPTTSTRTALQQKPAPATHIGGW